MCHLCSFPGYSVTTLIDGSTEYFVAGAPRSNHSGQVIVYTVNTQKQLTIIDSERGKQVLTLEDMVFTFFPGTSHVHVVCSQTNKCNSSSVILIFPSSVKVNVAETVSELPSGVTAHLSHCDWSHACFVTPSEHERIPLNMSLLCVKLCCIYLSS